MRDFLEVTLAITIGAILGLILGFSANDGTQLRKDAIQRGFAEYNQTNGQWQWKEGGK